MNVGCAHVGVDWVVREYEIETGTVLVRGIYSRNTRHRKLDPNSHAEEIKLLRNYMHPDAASAAALTHTTAVRSRQSRRVCA